MLSTIVHLIFLIIFLYLAFGIIYLFIISCAGLIRQKNVYTAAPLKKRIAVIIPSYREDRIILDTALQASRHNYPKDLFEVFVAADSLQPETIQQLRAIPVNVLEVKFDISTKAKSLNAILQTIPPEKFELAIILDADNIIGSGCLETVNAAFQQGAGAVQCHRTAKNRHTAVAVLDAISEEINNHLFRKGPRAFHLSASVIGSGMAFRFSELKAIFDLPYILDNPGEDREIEVELMKHNIIVEYADDAIVLDEKVSQSAVFERQRVRWLEAQLHHFRRFFSDDVRSVNKNLNYWNKFIQTILLPRSLYILTFAFLLALMTLEWIFQLKILFPSAGWWIGIMVIFSIALLFAIPRSFYNGQTLKALSHLPVLVMKMFRALLRVKSNRQEFLHTPKTFTS